jgi:hypothetical protein
MRFRFLLVRWLRGQLTEAQVQLFRLTGWLTAAQAEEILKTDRTNPTQRIEEILGELEKTP